MTYELGIDLGTTWTAAAVWRGERGTIVNLGTRQAAVPSIVYIGPDGSTLVGEAAERRVLTEPERVARQFKRRIGDPAPILLGGAPHSAELLTAKLLRWVVDAVASREGEMPTTITITHPANWGAYKKDLLEQAVHLAGLSGPGNPTIRLLTEPEAAAIHYASTERVESGQAVAVYDLGGGTFDVAVLRATGDSFAILGAPEGIERLGGIDFDAAVLGHVARALGGLDDLDPDDPAVATAVAHLRDQCTAAKEALSVDTQTIVPVLLPGRHTEVRLTRPELEAMLRPALDETIAATTRALRVAGVQPSDLRAIVLVGGSSRIPLVAQLVTSALGRPVAVDTDPKHAIALGAARHAHLATTGPGAITSPSRATAEGLAAAQLAQPLATPPPRARMTPPPAPPPTSSIVPPPAATGPADAPAAAPPTPPPPSPTPPPYVPPNQPAVSAAADEPKKRKRTGLLVGAGVAAIALVAAGV
ncbi:MAG TPA: Hsp70 family protein, partial [Acidimicrobiales bacterium]|nr:Hsp70 family protein [Acidimicrobiales bacterium]